MTSLRRQHSSAGFFALDAKLCLHLPARIIANSPSLTCSSSSNNCSTYIRRQWRFYVRWDNFTLSFWICTSSLASCATKTCFLLLCRLKPCPHCRRKVRLSHKSEIVAENGEIRRQSHFCETVSLFCTVWTGFKWSDHCLHHLLPSERDTGHDLRHRGHSYQLVCYTVILALLGVASLAVCCMIHCKHLR